MPKIDAKEASKLGLELAGALGSIISAIGEGAAKHEGLSTSVAANYKDLVDRFSELTATVEKGQEFDTDQLRALAGKVSEQISGLDLATLKRFQEFADAVAKNEGDLSRLISALDAYKAVRFDIVQDLTSTEQATARDNISAASKNEAAAAQKAAETAQVSANDAAKVAAEAQATADSGNDALREVLMGLAASVDKQLIAKGLLTQSGK